MRDLGRRVLLQEVQSTHGHLPLVRPSPAGLGLSLWIGGLVASMGNFDSDTSQSREPLPARPSEPPFPLEGSGPPQGVLQSALPHPTTLPLLGIHF
jgi:hypothetical protein